MRKRTIKFTAMVAAALAPLAFSVPAMALTGTGALEQIGFKTIAFTTSYLDNLFGFDWVQTRSPAGAIQWISSDVGKASAASAASADNLVPDAHLEGARHAPIMFTTDLSLKKDPIYREIAPRFQANPQLFADAFARAWFKLTHRDTGPGSRYLGMDVPTQSFIWLANNPAELRDLIVLGGSAGIEEGARQAGAAIKMPVTPGCVDASQGQTDAVSFAPLEPRADRFRNFYRQESRLSPAEVLVERADLLDLQVFEMTVLVGGMRALNANTGGSANGALTVHPGSPTNDFFVNLFDMPTGRSKSATSEGLFEVHGRTSGALKWTATPVDRVFGSNSELRAVAEVSASDDGKEEFMRDFVNAWTAVMTSRVLEYSNAAGEVTKTSGLCAPILPVEDEEIEVNHDCY